MKKEYPFTKIFTEKDDFGRFGWFLIEIVLYMTTIKGIIKFISFFTN